MSPEQWACWNLTSLPDFYYHVNPPPSLFMLFTIIWAHSPQIALKYDYIATKFGGGQLSSNGWISEPPVLATPPLQQRLKVLFFVRFVIFVRFWICNWYLWWQQCFCYCCVLDLEKALATLCVFCLVRYCPQHALPFTRPELRPLFVLFLLQRPRYCRRRPRRELFLKGGEKILIVFDRSVLAACPCQNISKKSYCSFFLVYFWWSRLIWKFSKNIFSGRGGLPKQCYCYNMPMLMEVTL